MNTLVACGGTGAHVALAMMRLHILGYSLGFFRQSSDKPLELPSIWLVDQDYGDGKQHKTAWQAVKELLKMHPGRFDWMKYTGNKTRPSVTVVTPLPVGSNRDWFNSPNNRLANRFRGSSFLHALTSETQRKIDYSLGMMGSPAVGSLLFTLKEFDLKQSATNNDSRFATLLSRSDRIAVVGSGIGGTGSSVAPTLAKKLATNGNKVMAVMVLRWFKFGMDGLDAELQEKSQIRNRVMTENANSALAYYGSTLAKDVATVPVGMPNEAVMNRTYTSDTQQPIRESYIHAVAALCCLSHFLVDPPYTAGLYQMAAESPNRLTGGIRIHGGTIQHLFDQATVLRSTLKAFRDVLSTSYGKALTPTIYSAVRQHVDTPDTCLDPLDTVMKTLDDQLQWMRKVLGVTTTSSDNATHFLLESQSRERLSSHRFALSETSKPELAALALFHWTGDWIRDEDTARPETMTTATTDGGFWPTLEDEGLSPSAGTPGELTRIPEQNVQATLEAFVNYSKVSQNGWPDPLAAADYFRLMINRQDPTARFQLELLILGLMANKLELRRTDTTAMAHGPRLEKLINAEREDSPGVADFTIVFTRAEGDTVVGFNSPHTLVCPAPLDRGSEIWTELWTSITGSTQSLNSLVAGHRDWGRARPHVDQVKSWLKVIRKINDTYEAPAWTQMFDEQSIQHPRSFGISECVLVKWGTGRDSNASAPVTIPLPTSKTGFPIDPNAPIVERDEFIKSVPDILTSVGADGDADGDTTFRLVENLERPGHADSINVIWQDHLVRLQTAGKIAAFRSEQDGVVILCSDWTSIARLENTKILNRLNVAVSYCYGLKQDPVLPSSESWRGRIKFPDLPVRMEYIGLVQNANGDCLLDKLKAGKDVDRSSIGSPRHIPVSQCVNWTLRFDGRSDTVPISLQCMEEPCEAHWMVWPKFRTNSADWKAYYIYEHCNGNKLSLDTLWYRNDQSRLAVRTHDDPRKRAYPISFDRTTRSHSGGPPLVFSARDSRRGNEVGLYLIPLKTRQKRRYNLEMGIDFGTSHTVGAFRVDHADQAKALLLPCELASNDRDRGLSLHISEDRKHVEAPNGPLACSTWMPTYINGVRNGLNSGSGLLPSELSTVEPLESIVSQDPSNWKPLEDCSIPTMRTMRQSFADHILADFKWTVSHRGFRGKEAELREIYIGMAMELILAQIVWDQMRVPEHVSLTFTYPLRTKRDDRREYQATLERLLARGKESFGSSLVLLHGTGLYNESRAGKGGTETFGEVSLVGDLGGGTLDIFISAKNGFGIEFDEVADSARLGGDVLLGLLAKHGARLLPESGGWSIENEARCTSQLRAWMRQNGAMSLFGVDSHRYEDTELHLQGFNRAVRANESRQVIDRYFRLVAEYMARSLAAFLLEEWYKKVDSKDHQRLRISVQLRGNGWLLRYNNDEYHQIGQEMSNWIRDRVRSLWDEHPTTLPRLSDRQWNSVATQGLDPKTGPIAAAVGKTESPREGHAWDSAVRRILVNLEVLLQDQSTMQVDWFARLPLEVPNDAQVEFHGIEPPFLLTSRHRPSRAQVISALEDVLTKQLNERFQGGAIYGGSDEFHTPVAPYVWEATLKSQKFVRLGKEARSLVQRLKDRIR